MNELLHITPSYVFIPKLQAAEIQALVFVDPVFQGLSKALCLLWSRMIQEHAVSISDTLFDAWNCYLPEYTAQMLQFDAV
jgi:hypothetical protein